MCFRFLRLPVLALLLLGTSLTIISSPTSASAQTTDPGAEFVPMVGSFTLWCTESNPGINGGYSPCPASGHHETPAIDISAAHGTTVYAVTGGEVVQVEGGCPADNSYGCNNGAGNYVVIDHGPRRSRYLHLTTINTSLGPIEAGALIGTTGNSGSTANPHLHYDEIADEAYGSRIKSGKMLACHGDKKVVYPDILGHSTWAKTPYGSTIRNDGYQCLIPGWAPAKPQPEPPTNTAKSRFVAIDPTRAFDTRDSSSPFDRLGAGEEVSVRIGGAFGVPPKATAVVLNTTAAAASGNGYLTVWPTGSERPLASSLNVDRGRATVANLVTVPLGTDGKVSFFASTGTDLLADIAGYYVPASGKQRAGRLVSMAPTRLLDTRREQPVNDGDRTVRLQVANTPTVPADARAVVVNLTATDTAGAGYVTAWPTGTRRPVASNLNPTSTNDTVPNMAIVRIGTNGNISLFSSRPAELIVDITGYVTGDSAEASRSGLFVPIPPFRVFDTRTNTQPTGALRPGASMTVAMADTKRMPSDVASLALNITATDAMAKGYVTVWPTGTGRPTASSLNLAGPRDTRPNAAYLPLGQSTALDYFSQSGTDLLVDVFGYFTS